MNTLALSPFSALHYAKNSKNVGAPEKSMATHADTLRQDTLNAWEHYQTTGLHARAAEVDAWLVQLEQGHDVEPPACHA